MEQEIIRLFNENYGYTEIAKIVGTTKENVRYYLSKNNLKRGYDYGCKLVKCECCGVEFKQKSINQKYCSSNCQWKISYKRNRKNKVEKKINNELINEMIALYKEGYTSSEIAIKFNVSSNTVRDKLKKEGIKFSNVKPIRSYYCEVCGKEYKSILGNNKYCSSECHSKWLKSNPRYTKVCKHCGIEFKTNLNKQMYCSYECGGKSELNKHNPNQYGTKEQRENKFRLEFNLMFKNRVEYVGGFKDVDSQFDCKCLKCNSIYSLGAQVVRKKGNAECPICNEQERIAKEIFNNTRRNLINVLKKVSRLKEKEQKELQKQLDYQNSIKEYECIYCGNKFMSDRYKKYCSNKCSKKSNEYHKTARRREMIKSNGHYDWSISIPKLIKRDKVCKLCGKDIDITDIKEAKGTKIAGDNYPSIDHIIPVSKGGTHTWDNVQLAHRGCNTKKNNKTDVIANKGRTQLSLNI